MGPALATYGVDAFVFESIASCKTQEDADAIETAIIAQYDSASTGYNVRVGGHSSKQAHCRKGHAYAEFGQDADGHCKKCRSLAHKRRQKTDLEYRAKRADRRKAYQPILTARVMERYRNDDIFRGQFLARQRENYAKKRDLRKNGRLNQQ